MHIILFYLVHYRKTQYPITPVQNRFILSSKALNPLGFNLISTNRMPYINVAKEVKASMKSYTIDFTNVQLKSTQYKKLPPNALLFMYQNLQATQKKTKEKTSKCKIY